MNKRDWGALVFNPLCRKATSLTVIANGVKQSRLKATFIWIAVASPRDEKVDLESQNNKTKNLILPFIS